MEETGGSDRVIEVMTMTKLYYRHMCGNATVKSTLYNFCLPIRNFKINKKPLTPDMKNIS